MEKCDGSLPPEALRGITLHNCGQFFQAHEALENAWRAEKNPVRSLYQGLLQISVTCYHIQHGNMSGACKVLSRALSLLENLPDTCQGVNVGDIREQALALQKQLAASETSFSAFPIMRMITSGG